MSTAGSLTYLRLELVRALRNTRFFLFSLVFPLILFLVVAGANRHETLGGIPFPVYYLAGMVSWGTMAAVAAGGARIAMERAVGWNRQLRLTPLGAWTYLRAKILSGYLVALMSIVLLYVAGIFLGVRLPADRWLEMTGLVLIGLVPFAALGIWLGHQLTPESMGPALGGITALFALLGGAWGPLASKGFILDLARALPSYWLVQAGHSAVTGSGWGVRGWVVIALWTGAFGLLAARAYRRDTRRV
ncbi:MAG: ABC transporter permease [Micromonosporaceae bacterium]|nr:ABC transporter permease [Micromonosporaceae bacterium]